MPRRGALRFNLNVVTPPDVDGLSPAELKQLVLTLLHENAEQKRVLAELREEVARLKGLKGRPQIKPSGMENGTTPKPAGNRVGRRGRGKARPQVSVEERVLKADVPVGSRFKGYEDFMAQEGTADPLEGFDSGTVTDLGWPFCLLFNGRPWQTVTWKVDTAAEAAGSR